MAAGGLGPLPPLNAPANPSASAFSAQPQPPGPAFSASSPAVPAVGMGLGPLPPIGAAPQINAPPNVGVMGATGGMLGPLPPLNASAQRAPSGPNQVYSPPGGDAFSPNSDPFSSGDPFQQAPPVSQAQGQFAPPTSESFPSPDPFAQSQSAQSPFAQPRMATVGPNGLMAGPPMPSRAQTIGPGGAVMPPIKPALPPIAPQPSVQDPWASQRVEPEIEESHTRVVQAVGAPRPKFLVTQLDGTEEGEFPLNEGENLVGREVGGMFAKDNLLSGRHATIIVQGQSVWVRDEGSRNGVYVRIPRQQHVELNDGDQFCIGRIILRFEFMPGPDSVGLLHLVVGRDVDKGMFPCRIPRTGITLGRNRADLRFPLDGWVSGLHCQIVPHGPQVMLVDLGSSNGTYQRIRGGVRAIAHHDALLMGQRIFHLHYG